MFPFLNELRLGRRSFLAQRIRVAPRKTRRPSSSASRVKWFSKLEATDRARISTIDSTYSAVFLLDADPRSAYAVMVKTIGSIMSTKWSKTSSERGDEGQKIAAHSINWAYWSFLLRSSTNGITPGYVIDSIAFERPIIEKPCEFRQGLTFKHPPYFYDNHQQLRGGGTGTLNLDDGQNPWLRYHENATQSVGRQTNAYMLDACTRSLPDIRGYHPAANEPLSCFYLLNTSEVVTCLGMLAESISNSRKPHSAIFNGLVIAFLENTFRTCKDK